MPEWADHMRPRLSTLCLSPAREHEIVDELLQHLEDRWHVPGTAAARDPSEPDCDVGYYCNRVGNCCAFAAARTRAADAATAGGGDYAHATTLDGDEGRRPE